MKDKRKKRKKQSKVGITLSVEEEQFLFVQIISLSSTQTSQRAFSVQYVLMEIAEV